MSIHNMIWNHVWPWLSAEKIHIWLSDSADLKFDLSLPILLEFLFIPTLKFGPRNADEPLGTGALLAAAPRAAFCSLNTMGLGTRQMKSQRHEFLRCKTWFFNKFATCTIQSEVYSVLRGTFPYSWYLGSNPASANGLAEVNKNHEFFKAQYCHHGIFW